MRTFNMPKAGCPWCGHLIDACSGVLGLDSPSPGDLSVCLNCAGLLTFDASLIAQKLEGADLFKVAAQDPLAYQKLLAYRRSVQEVE